MAKYFNTTRGPIAISLSSGVSVSFPPKRWTEIALADEGSVNLVPLLRKGFLKRSTLADLSEVVPLVSNVVETAAPVSVVIDETPTALPKVGEVKETKKK